MLFQVFAGDSDRPICETTDESEALAVLELTNDLHKAYPDEMPAGRYRAIRTEVRDE